MATSPNPTRDDFAALLDESLGGADGGFEGRVVKGTVTAIDNDHAVIDVGLKSEGRVALREFAMPGQKADLKVGDEVVSADCGRNDDALLIVTDAGYAKRTQIAQFPRKNRGGQGVIGVKITSKKGKVVAAFMVGIEDEIVAVASNGVTIRTAVRQISSQGRAATGVRLVSIDEGQVVASVAPILSTDDDE